MSIIKPTKQMNGSLTTGANWVSEKAFQQDVIDFAAMLEADLGTRNSQI